MANETWNAWAVLLLPLLTIVVEIPIFGAAWCLEHPQPPMRMRMAGYVAARHEAAAHIAHDRVSQRIQTKGFYHRFFTPDLAKLCECSF